MKNKVINLRLSEREYKTLKASADASGLTVSGYIRGNISRINLSSESITALKNVSCELSRIGNNLNQITRMYHQEGIDNSDISELLQEIYDCKLEVIGLIAEIKGDTSGGN